MSAKLLTTQLAAVTLGVIGGALTMRAIDKGTRYYPNKKVYVFEKLPRITGEYPTLDDIIESKKVK